MHDEQLKSEMEAMRRDLESLKAQRSRGFKVRLAVLGAVLLAGFALAQQPSLYPPITPFVADAPATALQVNQNFNSLRNSAVPQGAILLFAGPCPAAVEPNGLPDGGGAYFTGYTEVASTVGRIVIGAPSGANTGVTFGPALANGENREVWHTHTGSTSSLAGYAQGEVNYNVLPGQQTPFQMRQALNIDGTPVRFNDLAPTVYLRYCRKN